MKVPGNEWSGERKFHHGNECSRKRIVLGTNIPAFNWSITARWNPVRTRKTLNRWHICYNDKVDPVILISEWRRPPGLLASPTPIHRLHCQSPVPGLSPVTARSHRYIHQRRCALRHPFPANPLLQAVPPTWITTTPPAAVPFCEHVTCLQHKHG